MISEHDHVKKYGNQSWIVMPKLGKVMSKHGLIYIIIPAWEGLD